MVKVYTVVVDLAGAFFGAPHFLAYSARQDAERAAEDVAREHRGQTVYVVEGQPVAAFRAEPVKVETVPIGAV